MELQFDEDSHGISLIKLEPNFEESLDAEVNDISDDKVLNEGTEYESVVVKENGQEEGDRESHQTSSANRKFNKFNCQQCEKNYHKMHMLKTHMKQQHSENMDGGKGGFICDICEKSFASKIHLRKHFQWHAEGNKLDDEEHRKFVAENFNMKCDQCDVVFSTFHNARRHYKDMHSEKKGYIKCCDIKLTEFWLVIDHINSHLNPKTFKCEPCNKVFADRKKLYLHQRRHIQAITMPFICDYCGKHFRNKETITRHIFIIHVNSEPKFECKTCHKRFRLMSLLQNHTYSVHREKKSNVTCEFCGKSFSVKANFDKHMILHVDKSLRLAQRKQCNHCGEWLMTRSGIYYHEQIHQGGVQKCDQCKMELPHKLALRAHIRKHHRERNHKCIYCDKSFDIASKLRDHEQGHTRSQMYPCQYCSKIFNVQSSLQTHESRRHREQLTNRKNMRKLLQFSS